MKKLILILLFAAGVVLNTSAQVQKGAMLLEGSVNFYHSNSNDDQYDQSQITGSNDFKNTSFSIVPKFGYFFGNTFLTGLGAGYSSYRSESTYVDNNYSKQKSHKFSINPYLSKYFKISDKLYITGTFNFSVSFGKKNSLNKNDNNETEKNWDEFGFNMNITPGVSYFISKNWALSANIGQIYYSRSRSILQNDFDDKPKDISSNFGIRMDFNTFFIGLQYYLHH